MHKFKYSLLICLCFLLSFNGFAQKTIQATIVHDGLTRTFSFYVPAIYAPGNPTPLVFNLHGYGSNGDQQEFYGDFRKIADTANFIVVHPNGTLNQTNQAFWNCGLVGASSVDDVGFIHAMIDTLSKAYSIDPDRIYSTGMSNGGFMSYHMACVSNRFAAIASVTGSMTALTLAQCKNAHAIPVMEIHGNADGVVNYEGSNGVLSIPSVLDYWIAKNGLNKLDLIQTNVPNINTTDNATAELYIYPGVNEVQHYKIINGGHTWPGSAFVIGTTCQDFKASEVIWQFFARYKKQVVGTNDLNATNIQIFPNPVSNNLIVVKNESDKTLTEIQCMNQFGQLIRSFEIRGIKTSIDLSDFSAGIYYLHGQCSGMIYRTKFIKL